jgi:geranylgeranyl reductase family protein
VSRRVDVAVIGAGPAGCAAAITLAAAGRRVLLADRARFPRDKCCGDGLTTAAVRRLESLGLDPAEVPSFRPATELVVRSPSGRDIRLPLGEGPGVFAAVARRQDLDAALVALAGRAGADFVEGARCVGAINEGAGVRLSFEGAEEARARYVVAADGAWSPVRRMLAGPRETTRPPTARRPDWIAFRTYAEGVRSAAAGQLWVWFDAALLPGYAWSFPLGDGTVNLGICLRHRAGPAAADLWESTLARPFAASLLGPAASLVAPARAWPIPVGIDRAELAAAGGRVLFVGDAACAADPFTGEGVEQALTTGVLAARAIAAGTSPADAAARYSEDVAASIARDHRVSRACQRLFSTQLGCQGALRIVGASGFVRRNVARWLFGDYPRAVLMNPAEWPSLVRRSPGAFAARDRA